MKIRIAIVVCLALVILVLGVAAARTTREAWHTHQTRYVDTGRAKDPTLQVPIEIKQDRLLDFGEPRIDRCRTCHAAVDDPSFADGTQPLRTHASIAPHTFNEFGCTVCHEGDGRALDAALAHGQDPFWTEPLLKAPFIEAACARCHPAPYLDQTPHLKRGAQLFQKYACVGCHTVQGLSQGNLGIELTDIGHKRGVDFFLQKLENPLFNQRQTLMPTFTRMPKVDREDLAVFLKSLRGRSWAEAPIAYRLRLKSWRAATPPDVDVGVEQGRAAVEARGCTSCHKLGDADGAVAPDLSFLGQTRDAGYVAAHLADPRSHTDGSNMPNFFMSSSERQAISAYLTSLSGVTVPATPADQYKALCSRCHGEKGDGEGLIATNLLPRPRVFTNAKFFNWLPEERAHQAIRDGVPGTAMPPFGKLLDNAAAQALFAYVRSAFIGEQRRAVPPRKVPEKNPVAWSTESVKRGKDVFAARCYGCHGRLGDGKGPNALDMLPRPRNLASHLFFQELPDTRLYESIAFGIVGTGMPAWDVLSDEQRWDLVNYIRALSSTGAAASQPKEK